MKYNIQLRDLVFEQWQSRFGGVIGGAKSTIPGSAGIDELNNLKANTIQQVHYKSFQGISVIIDLM